MELVGGLADGQPAVNLKDRNTTRFANVDFHGQPVGHDSESIHFLWVTMALGHAARHYTLAGKLHKVSYTN